MRLALVAAMMPTDPTPPQLQVLASSSQDGPIVQGLSATVVGELVYDYSFNYPAFLQLSTSLVNQEVLSAETDQPEGAQMELVLTGLTNPVTGAPAAAQLANAVNSEWAGGHITDANGHSPPSWPGANQIAYASGSTLTLQWVKGQPWVWLIVGVLLAVAALALYEMLVHGGYTLSSVTSGSVGQVAAGLGVWVVRNWPVVLVGAGLLAVAPFVIREGARTREAVNEARYAAKGGF